MGLVVYMFQVTAVNVRGLNKKNALNYFQRFVCSNSSNVFAIQETKLKRDNNVMMGKVSQNFVIHENRCATSRLGLMMIFEKAFYEKFRVKVYSIGNRIMVGDIYHEEKIIRVINVHWPILDFNRQMYKKGLEKLIKKNGYNVIIGDVNVNNVIKEKIINETLYKYDLIDVADINDNAKFNTRFDKKSSNRLDRCYLTYELGRNLEFRNLIYPYSDHNAISVNIKYIQGINVFKGSKRMIPECDGLYDEQIYNDWAGMIDNKLGKWENLGELVAWNIIKKSSYEFMVKIQKRHIMNIDLDIKKLLDKAEDILKFGNADNLEIIRIKEKVQYLIDTKDKYIRNKIKNNINKEFLTNKDQIIRFLKKRKEKKDKDIKERR